MNPNETNMNNLDIVSADTSNSNTFPAHTHILEDGTVVTHTHNHSHPHHHENTKAVPSDTWSPSSIWSRMDVTVQKSSYRSQLSAQRSTI